MSSTSFNDQDLFKALFDSQTTTPELQLKSLLTISQPLLIHLKHNQTDYLIYVLRDKTLILDTGEKAQTQELLVAQLKSKDTLALQSTSI